MPLEKFDLSEGQNPRPPCCICVWMVLAGNSRHACRQPAMLDAAAALRGSPENASADVELWRTSGGLCAPIRTPAPGRSLLMADGKGGSTRARGTHGRAEVFTHTLCVWCESTRQVCAAVAMAPSASITNEAGALLRELPCEFWIVVLVEFLNSFRQFALGAALYQYMTLEFGLVALRQGWIKGFSGVVGTICGLSGSLLTDLLGVRRVSLLALSVACVGRGILFMTDRKSRSNLPSSFCPIRRCNAQHGALHGRRQAVDHVAYRPFAFSLRMPYSTSRPPHRASFSISYANGTFTLSGSFGRVTVSRRLDVDSHPRGMADVPAVLARRQSRGEQRCIILRLRPPPCRSLSNAASSVSMRRCRRWVPRGVPHPLHPQHLACHDVLRVHHHGGKQWGDLNDVLPPFLEQFYGENVPIFTISSINPVICSFARLLSHSSSRKSMSTIGC